MLLRIIFPIYIFIFFIGNKSSIQAQSRQHAQKQKHYNSRASPNEPNYIFLLPENQTIILRKSDFDHVIYPNVTNMNKFSKKGQKLKNKDLEHSGSVNKVNFYNNDDSYENIVKENVQTERNFVNFLEEMNYDLNTEEIKARHHHNNDKKLNKKSFNDKKETNNNKKKSSWDDFGLEGWEGALIEKKKNNTKNL